MRARNRFPQPGRAIYRSPRWRALRLEALRRDGFACTSCGARGRLEVHHREPVRDKPELAYALDNLTCLCGRCHAAETRKELGLSEISADRLAWRRLMAAEHPPEMEKTNA